ncbi:MAG: branched-chain amino acid ABC transporter permease [Devosia sp.]
MDALIFFINKAIVPGLITGSIYALGGIGVTLVFAILRFGHFAHGDMMTMGAFFAFLLATALAAMGVELPIPLGIAVLPVAMALTAVIALGLDRAFYAPLRARGARPVTLLIASIGVTLMIQGLIRLFFGSGNRDFFGSMQAKIIYRIPGELIGGTRPIVITQPQVLMFIAVIAVVIGLHYFLTRSRLGKAMRAMADNADLAQVSGINTQTVVTITWIIGGALACLGGTMLALDVQLKPDLAFNIVLPIFAAAIVGGLGNVYGAIAGGLLIGFSEALAVYNWSSILAPLQAVLPADWTLPANLTLVPTEYKLTVAFVILVITLLKRPTGLFKGIAT